MNKNPKEKTARIELRIKPEDKEKVFALAKRCGLSQTEYIKQRALGYEPRAVPPDALFLLLEKIGELESKTASPETEEQINMLLKEISDTLLLPGKDRDTPWQS